jgi:acetyl-CoA acetyltransferase
MARFENVAIPYGAYWSTPFVKWQGSLAHLNWIRYAADTARRELAARTIDPMTFEHAVLGMTIPQEKAFYGAPWMMSMLGNTEVGGTTVSQACATGARAIATSASEIEIGGASASLAVTPDGMAGAPITEHWFLDVVNDPITPGIQMIDTAENCAQRWQITTAEQHDVVVRRWEQYQDALADDQAFQKRYMTLPCPVPDQRFRKEQGALTGDEGLWPRPAEVLDGMKPVRPEGTVTRGGQTHPADGNAAVVLTSRERAAELSRRPEIEVLVRSYGLARADHAHMPAAPVPAAKRALDDAGLTIGDIDAIKTHNPFAVNDVVFARETGADIKTMNNYGCSLIWGHANAATAMRATIELVEELTAKGGGRGLFAGCAAGDTGIALVVEVRDTARH